MKLIGTNHSFSHTIKYLFCFGLLTLLASCGGGSSSDRSPDAFSFTAQTDVALSSPIDSNTVTITSINKATDISVTGGEYSIGGGTFTSSSGTVTENQSVVVRLTSSASNSTVTTATLTVGDKSGSFSVTTLADSIPDAFTFVDQTDVALSTEIESAPITVAGIDAAAEISIIGGEYSLDDGTTFTDADGTVTDGQSVMVRQTSSADNSTTTDAVLTIGGVADTFSVTTLPDTIPDAFSFTDQADVFLDSVIISDEITVFGIDIVVDISIIGGEYSIDDDEYTSAAGTVTNGQSIKVRVTSSSELNTLSETTLTISTIEAIFAVTTRTADASGIFNGTGTVNSSTDLADVKGIIRNERFMLFNEVENVLYDGQIQSYAGDTFIATVDVYKDGVNSLQVNATGTISNQSTITLVLNGADYGSGTINLTYNVLYERDATFERIFTSGDNFWTGVTQTVNTGQLFQLLSPTNETFTGGVNGVNQCSYDSGTKSIPDSNVNLYAISFNVEDRASSNCDHIGIGYSGFVTIVDQEGGGLDNEMWFAGTNGVNSNFSVLNP